MLRQKHKDLIHSLKAGRIVGLLGLALLFAGAPSMSAFADSQTFALRCTKNGTVSVDQSGSVGCSDAGEKAVIAATGSNASSQSGDAVATVSCSTGFAKNYKVGDSLTSFACKKGGKPTVTIASQGGAVTQSSCASDNSCSDPAIGCSASQCDLVALYVNPAIKILSGIAGTIFVISIIMGAIQYTSSGGDPQKTAAAKKRIFNTIFAMFAFLFLYAFLQFLVPGGIFNR